MLQTRVLATSDVPPAQLDEIRALLDASFDGEFSDDDWEHTLGGWHAIITDDDVVVAHAAVVPRRLHIGDRHVQTGYVEAVATAPDRQARGLGSEVMLALKPLMHETFEMAALSTDRISFYGRLGWERWEGPTSVLTPDELVRTATDDGGIMVLRFGPSIEFDVTTPIVCESRSGDDW